MDERVLGATSHTGPTPGVRPGGPRPPAPPSPLLGRLGAWLGAALIAAAWASPGRAQAAAEGEAGYPIHGSLRMQYRGRWTDDADDHDLFTTLSVDAGDATSDAVTGHFMGRVLWDLGGDDDTGVFAGLDDTYSSPQATLYHAYVDFHRFEQLDILRLGRQRIWETPETVVFDGALVETAELGERVHLGVYGGVPAHFYESSPSGDAVVGAYGESRLWRGGRARLDYMYLEDETRLGDHQNDLLGLRLWHQFDESLGLEADYSALEGRNRDAGVRGTYIDAEHDLSLQVSYHTLLETQKNYALEADPLWATLKDYEPFHQFGLVASKGFADAVRLELGTDQRVLDDSSDEGPFNHEYGRYYASLTFLDALVDGLAVSVRGDYWDDDQQDVQTWGLDLTKDFGQDWSASIGSYYALYKYDLFLDEERDDVRTYYVELSHDATEALTFDCGFDYEDQEDDQYQTLRVGARWLF